ncbi:hypothetical protein ABMX80_22115 [Vibrio vulnificus]|uniref:hypothetical protein n=1 Tax=Vibrio vulnificus TaxID=672 RepID=UPI00405A2C95
MDVVTFSRMIVTGGYSLYKQRKREQLIQAMSQAKIDLDAPELQNDEFIGCFLATEDAIAKCTSVTKFNALVSMFVNGVKHGKVQTETEQYQEVLSIISDLSLREIHILYHLYQFDMTYKAPSDEKSESVAEKQLVYVAEQFRSDTESVKAWIIRLKRTGLLISESELGTNEDQISFSMGFELHHLSSLAKELKSWVLFTFENERSPNYLIYREKSL